MISGRGLGHTGGTLDKLQSIPGFNINLSLSEFRRVLKSCGCGLIGQTAEIAPADKKLYALRDVTATVESPNLICASIMSKKLAEGIDGLVLDVKTGSGAFMKTEKDSVHLAELMVETGERMGKKMVALITDMDQPLGLKVGNALEVEECIEVMNGGGPADLREVSVELAAWMFYLADRTPSVDAGRELADKLIRDRSALKKFREIVAQQGGDPRVIDDPQRSAPGAASVASCSAHASGFVDSHSMRTSGNCQPGAGRRPRKERRRDRSRRRPGPAQESRRPSSGRRSALHHSLQLRCPARQRAESAATGVSYRAEAACRLETAIDPPRHFRKGSASMTIDWPGVEFSHVQVSHTIRSDEEARMGRLTGLLGLVTMLGLAYLFSSNRRAIRVKTVVLGLVLQFLFAIFVLRFNFGRTCWSGQATAWKSFLEYSFAGSQLVFGELGRKGGSVWA